MYAKRGPEIEKVFREGRVTIGPGCRREPRRLASAIRRIFQRAVLGHLQRDARARGQTETGRSGNQNWLIWLLVCPCEGDAYGVRPLMIVYGMTLTRTPFVTAACP